MGGRPRPLDTLAVPLLNAKIVSSVHVSFSSVKASLTHTLLQRPKTHGNTKCGPTLWLLAIRDRFQYTYHTHNHMIEEAHLFALAEAERALRQEGLSELCLEDEYELCCPGGRGGKRRKGNGPPRQRYERCKSTEA